MSSARVRNFLPSDTTCGGLLQELQRIWDEVGETESERDKLLLQLEQECLDAYKRKVDEASKLKARLHLQLAESDTELANVASALGERSFFNRVDRPTGTLREQLAAISPALVEMRQKKKERVAQFWDVQEQINKISGELSGNNMRDDTRKNPAVDERDLSMKRLDEFQLKLQGLQTEKSHRLQKVTYHVNTIRDISTVLAVDFIKLITEVHPSLIDSRDSQSKNISDDTLARLARTVHSLKEEKQQRLQKLQELGATLVELWNLMDFPAEEKKLFEHVTSYISASADEVKGPGGLAYEIIEQAEVEVQRLDELKASKMKELVLKKQTELDDINRRAHVEVDGTSARERLMDQINSGTDLSELLASMDEQIANAKEEALSRKEIMEKVEKWMASREEESWLEDYNKDDNRYNASKGAHKNLKRAERARLLVSKLPSLVETMVSKTKAWEEERGKPFLYHGVPLLSTLNEDTISRQEREEEKKRQRELKRIQELQVTEQETIFGSSRPSPSKPLASKKTAGQRGNSSSVSGTPRRLSVTPVRQAQSASKDGKREHSKLYPVNTVALSRDNTGSQASEIDSVASNT